MNSLVMPFGLYDKLDNRWNCQFLSNSSRPDKFDILNYVIFTTITTRSAGTKPYPKIAPLWTLYPDYGTLTHQSQSLEVIN